MRDRKHARILLEMAEKDFRAMRGMLHPVENLFDDEIFGFHA